MIHRCAILLGCALGLAAGGGGLLGDGPVVQKSAPAKPAPGKAEKIPPPKEVLPPPREARSDEKPPNLAEAPGVIPASAQEFTLDLDTALRLAEVENPSIGIARQAVAAALADQLRAQSMMLPHLRAGLTDHLHSGVLQNSFGQMRRVDLNAFYIGGGSRVLAAETVAFPAVQIYSHLGDAIFEPLAARQIVASSRSRAAAVGNDMLLQVSLRYLDLVRAEAALAAVRRSEQDLNQVVQITASYARNQQGRPADAYRAQSEALLLHSEEETLEEERAVAAAELGRLLNLDPSIGLRSPGGAIGIVQLVDPHLETKQLIQEALVARPELAALQADIQRRSIQVRQERTRPIFPTISVGYSAGGFGGNTNTSPLMPPSQGFGARTDFDVIAYWTLQNAGVGNHALQRQRSVERNEAVLERTRMVNQVGREVAQAHALSEAHYQKLLLAQKRLRTAELSFTEDLVRIRGNVGLPIEVLASQRLLVRARLSLVDETRAYDEAQFRLLVAIGTRPDAAGPITQRGE